MAKETSRKLDRFYLKLYRVATHISRYNRENALPFARILQEALAQGFYVDYMLSDKCLEDLDKKGKSIYCLRNKTLLYQVLDSGQGEINAIARLLLDMGADVNFIDSNNRNALIYAVIHKMGPSVVSGIIRRTKDINFITKNAGYEKTALGIVCNYYLGRILSEERAFKLISLLIRAGANPDADGTYSMLKKGTELSTESSGLYRCLTTYIEKEITRHIKTEELQGTYDTYDYAL